MPDDVTSCAAACSAGRVPAGSSALAALDPPPSPPPSAPRSTPLAGCAVAAAVSLPAPPSSPSPSRAPGGDALPLSSVCGGGGGALTGCGCGGTARRVARTKLVGVAAMF